MTLKRILIASALLNIILLSSTIFLANRQYQYKNSQDNKLELNNTQETFPTEIIQKSTATTPIPSETPNKSEDTTQISVPYYYSDLMENPIDKAYLSLVTDWSYSGIEFRNYQERYYEIWKEEYDKVLNILKIKAVYQQDKDDIEQFDNYIEGFFDNNNDFFETLVLGDYQTDPTTPEKNSWGNGTRSKLLEIRGKIYRNACIQIITLLDEGDYNFPNDIDYFKEAALSH